MRKSSAELSADGVTVRIEVEVDPRAWRRSLPASDSLSLAPNRKRAEAALLRRVALGPLRDALRDAGLAEPDRRGELLEAAQVVVNDERGVQGRRFRLGAERSA